MDVKTLCLGLPSINEACGYDLKKEFESIFKHFYSAGYGSIYPAFDAALRKTNPQHKMRSEFLAMLYFADHIEDEHLRTLMDDRVKEWRDAVLHIRKPNCTKRGNLRLFC